MTRQKIDFGDVSVENTFGDRAKFEKWSRPEIREIWRIAFVIYYCSVYFDGNSLVVGPCAPA